MPAYPFPDLTLPPKTILMNLLNEVNADTLPKDAQGNTLFLTTDICVFADPQPYGAQGANTKILFGTSLPSVYGAGQVAMTYNRIDVSKVIAAAQPTTAATMMSGALAMLNTEYALHLEASDIIDAPITDGVGNLNIAPSSLIYCGNIQLTFAAGTPAPTPVPSPAPTPSPTPVASFSYVEDQVNGLEVHFTDSSNDPLYAVTAWAWDFGDSAGTSTAQNPSYTYAAAGTFDVTLTITDSNGDTYVSDPVSITVAVASPDDGTGEG